VADSQRDQLVALPIPRPTAKLIPPRVLTPGRKVGG
jgi:hypothetical protein